MGVGNKRDLELVGAFFGFAICEIRLNRGQ